MWQNLADDTQPELRKAAWGGSLTTGPLLLKTKSNGPRAAATTTTRVVTAGLVVANLPDPCNTGPFFLSIITPPPSPRSKTTEKKFVGPCSWLALAWLVGANCVCIFGETFHAGQAGL